MIMIHGEIYSLYFVPAENSKIVVSAAAYALNNVMLTGDRLSPLRNGVLSKFSWQDETHRRLNLAR